MHMASLWYDLIIEHARFGEVAYNLYIEKDQQSKGAYGTLK